MNIMSMRLLQSVLVFFLVLLCCLAWDFRPVRADIVPLSSESNPLAIEPEKCVNCHFCEVICPEFAIFSEEISDQAG